MKNKNDEELRKIIDEGRTAEQELNLRLYEEGEQVKERVKGVFLGDANAVVFEDNELVWAATSRCQCSAGLAYPKNIGPNGAWYCSSVLTSGDPDEVHSEPKPFMYYEIKSEKQPSAKGATTRPILVTVG